MAVSLKPTIIITGAAGGIGTGFVTAFLKTKEASTQHGIYIYHPSAPGTLQSLLEKRAPEGHTYELVPLDLSDTSGIRDFCKGVNERVREGKLGRIGGMMLIAGGIFTSRIDKAGLEFSHEGVEMTFAVNYVANFLLSVLLLRSMENGQGDGKGKGCRVVFLSSTTHDPKWGSNAFAIKKEEHKVLFPEEGVEVLANGSWQEEGSELDRFGAALRRYGRAKLCGVLWMYELQRRLNSQKLLKHITILAHDPAAVGGTPHYERHTFPIIMYIMLKYLMVPIQAIACWFWPNGPMRTTRQVGRDLVWMMQDRKVLGDGKAAYVDGRRVVESSVESRDREKQGRLWRETVALVGLRGEETVLELGGEGVET